MRALGVFLVAAVIAVGTWFGGWLAVPLCAIVYAIARRERSAPLDAAAGAALAWLALLLRLAPNHAFGTLLLQLGQIFPAPGLIIVAVTVLLAALLAGTSARVALGVVGIREASRQERPASR